MSLVPRARLLLALLVAGALVLAACSNAPAPPPAEPTTAAPDAPTAVAGTEPTAAAEPAPAEPTAAGEPASEAAVSDLPYRVGIFEDITNTNVWNTIGPGATAWNFYVNLPQYGTLYTTFPTNLALVPAIAAGMPERPLKQEGELFYADVKLKPGVSWSDGTPLTAEDIAFTASTAMELQIPGNWSSNYDPTFLDRVEAVDPQTVRFYYKEDPGLAIHEYGTLQGSIAPRHYWQPVVDEATQALEGATAPAEGASEADVAAYEEKLEAARQVLLNFSPDASQPTLGGFTLGRWEKGAFVENVPNPAYYAQGATITTYADGSYTEVQQGQNAYEEIVGELNSPPTLEYTEGPLTAGTIFNLYTDQNAALLALQNGEIDFLLNPSGLQKGLRAQVDGQEGITVIDNPSNGFRFLGFNFQRAPMNDRAFRQAVAVLIDKEYIANTLLQGVAFPMYSFIPEGNSFWYSDNITKFGLKDDGTPMTRAERVDEAVRILEEAGYSWEGGQKPAWDQSITGVTPGGRLIMPDGAPVPDLTLIGPNAGYDPLRATFAIHVEQWLNEVGVPLRAELIGFNVVQERTNAEEKDWDMFILGWGLTPFPDHIYRFFSEEQAVPGGQNDGYYVNPEFEEIASRITTCKSFDECKQIADETQQFLAEDLPYVVLFTTTITEPYRSDTIEFPFTTMLDGLQNINGLPTAVYLRDE
jgi:peptide/nickel transport system substrate-binding protein